MLNVNMEKYRENLISDIKKLVSINSVTAESEENAPFGKGIKKALEECLDIAKKLGFKVLYTGETSVQHKYMQSTTQSKTINFERLKMRNWLLIALRHYSLRDKLRMLRDYLKFIF